jgi:iron complex transport system ATP-binding protein
VSFAATGLGFSYGLREATFELPSSGTIAIAGPNGAGKSTLIGIMAGLRTPYLGSCTYGGVEVRKWRRRDFAKRVAFLPQTFRMEFPFTVEQVVFMGRTPYAGGWFESPDDHQAVAHALEITDTQGFRTRDFRTLSGGERQRVILASALAQQPETLLLDEPTTFLDLKHQLALYRLLAELGRGGMLVVTVTHDLNLALQFSDQVIVLDAGRVAAQGSSEDVLLPELIARVFGVHAQMHSRPQARPWIGFEA